MLRNNQAGIRGDDIETLSYIITLLIFIVRNKQHEENSYIHSSERKDQKGAPYTLRKTQPAISAVKMNSSLMAGFFIDCYLYSGIEKCENR